MLRHFFATLIACLAMASPVAAATVTSQTPDFAALAPTTLLLPTGSTWRTDPTFLIAPPDIRAGYTPGQWRSPFQGSGVPDADKIEFFNVAGNGVQNAAQLLLPSLQNVLQFLWGSPDSYNYVTLINRTGPTWTSMVIGLGNLGSPDPITPRYGASLVTISGFAFDKVEFFSNRPAFEFSNVTTMPAAVPVPAAGLMLLGALGGLASLRRRKAI